MLVQRSCATLRAPPLSPLTRTSFVQKTRRGAFILKNKHLNSTLQLKYGLLGEDLERAWDKIQEDGGSVQDLLLWMPMIRMCLRQHSS